MSPTNPSWAGWRRKGARRFPFFESTLTTTISPLTTSRLYAASFGGRQQFAAVNLGKCFFQAHLNGGPKPQALAKLLFHLQGALGVPLSTSGGPCQLYIV